MDGILVSLGEVRIGYFFFRCCRVVCTGFDIPVLRLLGDNPIDFYAGPGVSIPAVNDFLANADLQLVSEGSYDLKEVVFRNGCFKIDIVGDQDGYEKILQIGFRRQNLAAGIGVALKEDIVAFVTFAAGYALEAEQVFALKVEMLELIEVHRTVIARFGTVRITYHTGYNRFFVG
jgi:hypothetical protein